MEKETKTGDRITIRKTSSIVTYIPIAKKLLKSVYSFLYLHKEMLFYGGLALFAVRKFFNGFEVYSYHHAITGSKYKVSFL